MNHFSLGRKIVRYSFALLYVLTLLAGSNYAFGSNFTANYPNSSANLPAGNSAPAFNDSTPAAASPAQSPAGTGTPFTNSSNSPARSSEPYSHSLGVPRKAQESVQPDSQTTTVVPARSQTVSPLDSMDLLLGPQNVVARPGSEVILTAGVRDRSGYLRTNQRIDWSISPESVGHFSKIQERDFTNFLVFDFVKPQILSDTQAVTTTSRSEMILDRGTPNPNDDIAVRRGESWISVSSPREGVTLVSAIAPNAAGAQCKVKTARIIWVDAAVKLPESKVLDFGSTYSLTTALRKVSNEMPLERWRVQYRICGNSTAVFGDGNKMLEVYSDSKGLAKIEMRQPVSRQENTVVSVQIIRPADENFPHPVVVQDSRLHFTWKPNTVNIVKSMQKQAFIGTVVPAAIHVMNLTDKPLENLRVVDIAQPGLVLKGAQPEGEEAVDGHQWIIEKLEPYATYSIQLNYRVEQPGSYLSTAQVKTQKMGNDLIVECTASLSAGSDTSPYTPQMPNSANGSENSAEGNASSPDEASASSIGNSNPAGEGATAPLPAPEEDSNNVYVPNAGTNSGTETENSANGQTSQNPSGSTDANANTAPAASTAPSAPNSGLSEIAASDGQLAQVFPQEDPNALIGLNILAPAKVRQNEDFTVFFKLSNRTVTDLQNVRIQVINARGLSNKSQGDPYFVERNIRTLTSQKLTTIKNNFHAVLAGEQTVTVQLILPNGKVFRREARLLVLEAAGTIPNASPNGAAQTDALSSPNLNSPSASPSNSPQTEGSASGTPSSELENSGSSLDESELPDASNLPGIPAPDGTDSISPEVGTAPKTPAAPAVPETPGETAPENTLPDSLELPNEISDPANPDTAVPGSPASAAPDTASPASTAPDSGSPADSQMNGTQSSTIKQPANPLPEDSSETLGTLFADEEEQTNPSMKLKLVQSTKEVTVGQTFSYSLALTNTTNQSLKQLEILVALPPENVEIQQDSIAGPTEVEINTKTGLVQYAPIAEIAAGQTVKCQIEVKALKAGAIQAHVQILENAAPTLEKVKETRIQPPQK